MNILQSRIEPFQAKWPHNNNSNYCKTESFAKAGFYFVGKPNARDSVRCFLCDIELSNWQPNQSPFVRHGNESPRCAWTRLKFPDAHKRALYDPSKAFVSPRSIRMRSARLATFNCNKYWPPKKDVTKYPSAAKLANAGFYFSPTASLPSRVKCVYCGEATTVNPNETDLLNKHRNLSIGCTFFKETYNTRSSRSNKNSRESRAKGDASNTDSSTSKRTINTVSTSSETSSPISKRQKERSKALELVASKKRTSRKEPAVANKAKYVQKDAPNTDDSTRSRAMITDGSSRPAHHVRRSTRNNPRGVNILPDSKSSTEPKIIRTRCLQKPEGSGSGTSVPATNPPRKISLSASPVTDSTAPPTKKSASTPSRFTLSLEQLTPSIPKERDYVQDAEGSGTSRQTPANTDIQNESSSNIFYDTQDSQEVFPYYVDPDTPISRDTEGELRLSPVYPHDEYFDDKENILPTISNSPVCEYTSIYNDPQNEDNQPTPAYYPSSPSMHVTNYSPEPASPFYYTPSPPPHPAYSGIVHTEEELSQARILSERLPRSQKMTAEEQRDSMVDNSKERLQEIRNSDIRKIEEKFNLTGSRL
ncbi:hypothetical protein HPULCUR_008210 [Helicostylum pulchrum]|uniref:Uncharacterized protein n=1 Tax=Helicostylum pulchrum TaxID=562976 RepID=A0ABP9Y701_9FUNG